MKIFGNIDISFVSQNNCTTIRNFFQSCQSCQSGDCVILTLNEQENVALSLENCCINNCITNDLPCDTRNRYLRLRTSPRSLVSYYGNLYNDEMSVKNGIIMYGTDKICEGSNTVVTNLNASFENIFSNKKNIYDMFHTSYTYDPGLNVKILARIKSVFPFFLALNYKDQWKCKNTDRDHNHEVRFEEPPVLIKYCDATTFKIHETFDPANIVAYIGCNKPFGKQIDDCGHILDKYAVDIGYHRCGNLKAAKHKEFEKEDEKTAWNVLHTIAREIIDSDPWKNAQIPTAVPGKYNYGELGSLIKFLFKRLEELNANEMIDKFLKYKDDHIQFIIRVFELVIECNIENRNGKTYLRFKDNFHAAEHVYRHYEEIRRNITEKPETPLLYGSLSNYPMQFPKNLNDEDEIRKCIIMYLYDVPVQYEEGTLTKGIILSDSLTSHENVIKTILADPLFKKV